MIKTFCTRNLEVLALTAIELKSFLETIESNDEKNMEKFIYMRKVLLVIPFFVFSESDVDNVKARKNFLAMCYEKRDGDSSDEIVETMGDVLKEYSETTPEPATPEEPETTYVLMHDWACDDDSGNDVLGVYSTEKTAREGFERYRKLEMQEAEKRGYTVSTDTDYEFDAYIPGFRDEDHTNLYLKIVKTKGENA